MQADIEAFQALQAITTYAPANTDFGLGKITNGFNSMQAKQTEESQKVAAAEEARDFAAEAEWEFHNLMLGAKAQVIAQYGEDSTEVQSVGLKRKSEYKNPGRKAKSTGA